VLLKNEQNEGTDTVNLIRDRNSGLVMLFVIKNGQIQFKESKDVRTNRILNPLQKLNLPEHG
jgi:hypothetical protein